MNKLKAKMNIFSEISQIREALRIYRNVVITNIPIEMVYKLTVEPTFRTPKGFVSVTHSKSSFYYSQLMIKNVCKLNLDSWKMDTSLGIKDIPNICNIMSNKIIKIRVNKVIEFNYKLINRIGACGFLVNHWNKSVSKNCNVCGKEETQMHIIYQCKIVKNIWSRVGNYIGTKITPEKILFGTNLTCTDNNLISHIAYSIHKYWLIRNDEKANSCEEDLSIQIKNDLKFKSQLFRQLNLRRLTNKFNNALVVLFPHR